MRLHIISDFTGVRSFTRKIAFLVYYPRTEFVVFTSLALPINIENNIKEAILHTFNADKLLVQNIRGQAAKHLAHVIKTRKSQGVFSQLRTNIAYSNPLNIRQKSELVDEETYVDKGEKSRRIRAVNDEEVDARLKSIIDNFGDGEFYGRTSLSLDVAMPLQIEDESDYESDNDNYNARQPVTFELIMKGENIAKGLRNMISHGQITSPVPDWLEAVGSSNITKLYINENGASEKPESGSESESEEDDNEDESRGNREDESVSRISEDVDDEEDKSIPPSYNDMDTD